MSELVVREIQDHIAILKMNRPETRNAISDMDMIDAIVESLEDINADENVRVGILTGNGPAFSSGGNIKSLRDWGTNNEISPAWLRQNYLRGIQRIPLTMSRIDVPMIAAVNGPAIGAGCDLSCMCDMRIAADNAKFAESFVKLGIIPGDGGAWFLPRVVGMSKASEMAFTGDVIDAQEALACGLVSKVVPAEKLLEAAIALAKRVAVNPPGAVRMAKRLLREGQHTRIDTLLELSAAMQAVSHKTDDHVEAMSAMFDKRQGEYTGK